MSLCGCLGTATASDDIDRPKTVDGSTDSPKKPLENGLSSKTKISASGERASSMRRKNENLPTLPEHPEEAGSGLCTMPSGLLVNGAVFAESPGGSSTKKQSFLDAKIMASYDSVLMDTESTILGMDSASVRSSVAPSSRHDLQDEEDYDNFGTPQWTIDPHDIFFVARNDSTSKVCRIGRGEHGPVYLGVWQEHDVAVKLSKQRPTSYRAERQFHSKVAQLYSISHPNIVKFYGACFWKGGKRCVALTEYMNKGSLSVVLENRSQTPGQIMRTISIGLDIAKGLDHLHSIGVVHGRIKGNNVLFNSSGQAKIAVPCLSTLLNHVRSHSARPKTQNFEPMPIIPEFGKGGGKSTSGDIYCFGVLLYRLFTNDDPTVHGFRPIRSPGEAPAKIAWLVDSCLDEDPDSRPTARMLVSNFKNHCMPHVKG